ncbi:MAG: hypothetical protein FJX64_00235 [Alphaproteobacteria bacterium]|nr:hypothetical protein [Alphaproteobacteria bacterium]
MAEPKAPQGDADLSDMLQELRVLQQGAQVLTAFLVILPFTEAFEQLGPVQHWVFLATFLSSLASLVFLSAPAANHRLQRPVTDKEGFKATATRTILIGVAFESLAWVLVADLVVSAVFDGPISLVAAGLTALLVLALWWLMPLLSRRARGQR